MNRRYIIYGISALVVAVGAIVWFGYLGSLQKVTLIYDESQGKVQLSGNRISGTIDTKPNQEMTLQKGVYQLRITGENAKHETRTLLVQETPVTQTVPISLPDKKLGELRVQEFSAIQEAATKHYPALLDLYIFNDGTLYDRGQWYATTLTYKGEDRDNRDTLRLIAQKESNTWKLVTKPLQPLVYAKDHPDVPKGIIDSINKPAYLPGAPNSPEITPGQ